MHNWYSIEGQLGEVADTLIAMGYESLEALGKAEQVTILDPEAKTFFQTTKGLLDSASERTVAFYNRPIPTTTLKEVQSWKA